MAQATGWQHNGVLYAGLGNNGYGLNGGGIKVYSYNLYNVISSNNPICSNSNFSITNQPSGSTINWTSSNPGGLSINSSGVATRTNNYSGQITISAAITDACGSSFNVPNTVVWVGNPQVNIWYWPYISCGSSDIFNIYPPPQGTSIQWGAWGALRIIGASTGNHANVSSNGDQGQDGFVYVTLTNSCGQDSYYGPDYIPCEYDYLMVYPNPTSDELFISLDDNSNSSKSDQTYEIQLFNDKQEKVFSLRNNEKITKISTKNFQKGAYILRVNHNNGKEERRIILQ